LGLITCWSCIAAVNFSHALSRPRGRQCPHASAGRQAALCDLEAVGLLRHRLHYRLQRPARCAIERDERAIARWVAEDWP
jgi:hypothetical protein